MPQKRIYAFLIDLLIAAVPTALLTDLAVFVWKVDFNLVLYPAAAILILLLMLKDIRKGQSPGKYFMNLRVVSKSGNPVNFLLRNIFLMALPVDVFLFLVVDKRIGDIVFKTEVVANEHTTIKKTTQLMATIFVTLLALYMSAYELGSFYIRQRQEYIIMEAFIQGSKAIQEKTGEVIKLDKNPAFSIKKQKGQIDLRVQTKVYGKKEDVDLIIFMSKKDGEEWAVKDFKYANK